MHNHMRKDAYVNKKTDPVMTEIGSHAQTHQTNTDLLIIATHTCIYTETHPPESSLSRRW